MKAIPTQMQDLMHERYSLLEEPAYCQANVDLTCGPLDRVAGYVNTTPLVNLQHAAWETVYQQEGLCSVVD